MTGRLTTDKLDPVKMRRELERARRQPNELTTDDQEKGPEKKNNVAGGGAQTSSIEDLRLLISSSISLTCWPISQSICGACTDNVH